ncbi:hypothetical protein EDD11_005502 [Mortierella claussenii]|nr:hypothetical protein EDD11_005502 [Mortierella claussenii]
MFEEEFWPSTSNRSGAVTETKAKTKSDAATGFRIRDPQTGDERNVFLFHRDISSLPQRPVGRLIEIRDAEHDVA